MNYILDVIKIILRAYRYEIIILPALFTTVSCRLLKHWEVIRNYTTHETMQITDNNSIPIIIWTMIQENTADNNRNTQTHIAGKNRKNH